MHVEKQRAITRLSQIVIFLLVVLGLLLFGAWLPAMAQEDRSTSPASATPETVVLPQVQMHVPLVYGNFPILPPCPITSTNQYESIAIEGKPRNPAVPPEMDPDLNLMVRGYKPIIALPQLVAIDGPTDHDAPQLAYLFRPVRVPVLRTLYQIHEWDWACCPLGRLGVPIAFPEVTLVEMIATPGEVLYAPRRSANLGGDHFALVLYADEHSITFTYTREDSPANGYLLHLQNLCVDPNLLALYQEMHIKGRDTLPALRLNDPIGMAPTDGVLVAVRDTGSFMDPRSGKDWWQDIVRALLAAHAGQ